MSIRVDEQTLASGELSATLSYASAGSKNISVKIDGEDGATGDCSINVDVAQASSPWDFGGMFATGVPSNFPNPITGGLSCADGYTPSLVMGTINKDYTLYFCYRAHQKGVPSQLNWGGASGGYYNGSASVYYINPATENPNDCPPTYTERFALGTNNIDYGIKYCTQENADDSSTHTWEFGGMYSPPAQDYLSYTNPISGGFDCPEGFSSHQIMGSVHTAGDAPVFVCHRLAP